MATNFAQPLSNDHRVAAALAKSTQGYEVKYKVQFTGGLLQTQEGLIGRILRDPGEAASELELAKKITKAVGDPGATPVFAIVNKKQFVGFLPARN